MRNRTLSKVVDDILETVYDAADVPHIHRKDVSREIDDLIEGMVGSCVEDAIDDNPSGIKHLKDRIDELEDDVQRISRALNEFSYKIRV